MSGETIYNLRRKKGISQEKMAESLNICRETYNRMEKRPETITIRDAIIISKVLDVSLCDIFFNHDSN